jgi:hypothetical protein
VLSRVLTGPRFTTVRARARAHGGISPIGLKSMFRGHDAF